MWLPPFRVELTLHGSTWGDFAFFGLSDFLLSGRAAEAFQAVELTGLSGFETVETVGVTGPGSPPEYHHVAIAQSDAIIDENESSIARIEDVACDRCRSAGIEAVHGFVLERGTSTREDVFFARGLPGIVIASGRFAKFAQDHALTNVRFVPTDAYEWNSIAPTLVPS